KLCSRDACRYLANLLTATTQPAASLRANGPNTRAASGYKPAAPAREGVLSGLAGAAGLCCPAALRPSWTDVRASIDFFFPGGPWPAVLACNTEQMDAVLGFANTQFKLILRKMLVKSN